MKYSITAIAYGKHSVPSQLKLPLPPPLFLTLGVTVRNNVKPPRRARAAGSRVLTTVVLRLVPSYLVKLYFLRVYFVAAYTYLP